MKPTPLIDGPNDDLGEMCEVTVMDDLDYNLGWLEDVGQSTLVRRLTAPQR